MSRFDEFVRRVEAEAEEEGPGAVAELEALRDHYRLARELARRRHALSWTQVHLAELSGVPQSEISRIERGRANPTVMTVSRLSRALGAQLCLCESCAPPGSDV
jgi:ribosome-binding protein aMBF1 (putative translation factor)